MGTHHTSLFFSVTMSDAWYWNGDDEVEEAEAAAGAVGKYASPQRKTKAFVHEPSKSDYPGAQFRAPPTRNTKSNHRQENEHARRQVVFTPLAPNLVYPVPK